MNLAQVLKHLGEKDAHALKDRQAHFHDEWNCYSIRQLSLFSNVSLLTE